MRLGAPLTSHIGAFARCRCLAAAFLPPLESGVLEALKIGSLNEMLSFRLVRWHLLQWYLVCDVSKMSQLASASLASRAGSSLLNSFEPPEIPERIPGGAGPDSLNGTDRK